MKSNKGVALTSLVIYILGLVIVAGIIGSFSTYFYNKINLMILDNTLEENNSKFLSYLTKDVNSKDIVQVKTDVEEKDCLIFKFSDGREHQYINQDGYIFYISNDDDELKKITLCNNVSNYEGKVFSCSYKQVDINLELNGKMFSSSFIVDIDNGNNM